MKKLLGYISRARYLAVVVTVLGSMFVSVPKALAEDVTLSGQVTGSNNNQPVENVYVELTYSGFVVGSDTTDATGNYAMTVPVYTGFSFTLIADPPVGSGYLTAQQNNVTVTTNTVRNIALTPAPATSYMIGTVAIEGVANVPAGTLAEVFEAGTTNLVTTATASASSGSLLPSFWMTGQIPYGVYDVKITPPAGYENYRQRNPGVLLNVELDSSKTFETVFYLPQLLHGKITGGAHNEPIAGAVVSWTLFGGAFSQQVVTDAAGNYEMEIVDYTYPITVTPPIGSGYHTWTGDVVVSGSTLHNVTLTAADTTPPEITAQFSTEANEAGWHRAPVTLTWDVSDAGSPLYDQDGCDAVTVDENTSASGSDYTCTAESVGGSNSQTATVKYDATAPVADVPNLSPNAITTGDTTTLTVTGDDALSGVVAAEYYFDDPEVGPGTEITPNGEGDLVAEIGDELTGGQHVVYVRVRDAAGNWSDFKQTPLDVTDPDTTPPTVTGTPDRAPNAAGWYNANVTIDWHATDPSPSSGTPTDPANLLAALEGEHTYTSGQSCDAAGNCATGSLTLKIDKTAPNSFTMLAPLNGASVSGIYRFKFQIVDNASGIKKIVANVGGVSYSWAEGSTAGAIKKDPNDPNGWYIDVNTNNLPEGTSHIVLRPTDRADNVRYWNNRHDQHSFIVDNVQ